LSICRRSVCKEAMLGVVSARGNLYCWIQYQTMYLSKSQVPFQTPSNPLHQPKSLPTKILLLTQTTQTSPFSCGEPLRRDRYSSSFYTNTKTRPSGLGFQIGREKVSIEKGDGREDAQHSQILNIRRHTFNVETNVCIAHSLIHQAIKPSSLSHQSPSPAIFTAPPARHNM